METAVNNQKKALLKRFHVLLGRLAMGEDDKLACLSAYGVQSSKDLGVGELLDLCNKLQKSVYDKDNNGPSPGWYGRQSEEVPKDKLRKRLIAVIFKWSNEMGIEMTMPKVLATAARAAKRENFNDIPSQQLNSLYAAFNKKINDLKNVESICDEYLLQKAIADEDYELAAKIRDKQLTINN